jgi:aspartate aminotransferase-like enzyme
MIHHRSPEFEEIFASLRNNLHLISQTDGESVLSLRGSGTAAMELLLFHRCLKWVIMLLVVDAGKFGKRWAEICKKRYELNVSVQKPWGTCRNCG